MVQVDIFWSYAIGAGFAISSAWQLEREASEKRSAFAHPSFRDMLLFLGILFVPSGICLLWAFTSWETMHVGDKNMPAWIVTLFAMTNMTQGVLGFAVVHHLLRKGRRYAAYLQWILGYLGMFFILVHGWDGTGYQRFFSPTKEHLEGWTWSTAGLWLTSDVALTLYGMGVFLLPAMLGLMGWRAKQGLESEAKSGAARPEVDRFLAANTSAVWLGLSFLIIALTGVLGSAIVFSILIRYLGAPLGTAAFLVFFYLMAIRKEGLFYRHFRQIVYAEPFFPRLRPAPRVPTEA